MKAYRIRRPQKYDNLLNLLKDREHGVFSTFKSALIFAAAVGFKNKKRVSFSDTGEPIALSLFSEHQEQPFMLCLALTEFDDVAYLREEKFLEAMQVFEEYAAGGLEILDGSLDKAHFKESIESLLTDNGEFNLLDNIADVW